MKTLTLTLALLLALAAPTSAITRGCTTAMVNLGLCRTVDDGVSCVSMSTLDPDGAGPRKAPSQLTLDAFATLDNWQATLACDPSMVPVGICTTPQVGQLVAVSKVQFLDWRLRLFFFDKIKQYQDRLREAEKAAEAAAELPPDIGN